MKNAVFKIIALSLSLLCMLAGLIGCSEDGGFIHVTVGELTAKLPRDMRPTTSDYYDLYYTSLATSFGVVVLDSEKLVSLGERADLTLDEYLETFLSVNGIDRTESGLYFSAKQNAYRLTYLSSPDGENYRYHNTLIVGGKSAIYYVDISCDEDKAQGYEQTFILWANGVKLQ